KSIESTCNNRDRWWLPGGTNRMKSPDWRVAPDIVPYCFSCSERDEYRSGGRIVLRAIQMNQSRSDGVRCNQTFASDVQKCQKHCRRADDVRGGRPRMDRETYPIRNIWAGQSHWSQYIPHSPPSIFSISILPPQNQIVSYDILDCHNQII